APEQAGKEPRELGAFRRGPPVPVVSERLPGHRRPVEQPIRRLVDGRVTALRMIAACERPGELIDGGPDLLRGRTRRRDRLAAGSGDEDSHEQDGCPQYVPVHYGERGPSPCGH